jgi:hypothetical protein
VAGSRSLNVALRQILNLYVCLRPARAQSGETSEFVSAIVDRLQSRVSRAERAPPGGPTSRLTPSPRRETTTPCHRRLGRLCSSTMAGSTTSPDSYVVKGNQSEQTRQAGNAVSSNVAQWIGTALGAGARRPMTGDTESFSGSGHVGSVTDMSASPSPPQIPTLSHATGDTAQRGPRHQRGGTPVRASTHSVRYGTPTTEEPVMPAP